MARARTLRGLAHDVVDHSMSAFGYLHPHLAEYARSHNLAEVTVDLLGTPPISGRGIQEPLRLASSALQEWFAAALKGYGFRLEDLNHASLTCGAFGPDGYSCGATARFVTLAGKEFGYERGWPPAQRAR